VTGSLLIYLAQWAFVLLALALAWCFGTQPERRAVALFATAYALSIPSSFIHLDLIVAIDVALAAGLVWLALNHRRWWLLLAAGNALIVLVAHYAVWTSPDIYIRASITYRALPGLTMAGALALSPIERWLAGEGRLALAGWSVTANGKAAPKRPSY
jgi:hypothetical protein